MKKRNIFIELTPLLDVVLLILFLVLVQSQGRVTSIATEAADTLAAQMDDLYAQYAERTAALDAEFAQMEASLIEAMGDEMDMLRGRDAELAALRLGLEEDTFVVLVSIAADAQDRNVRRLLVETVQGSTAIDLTWDTFAREQAALDFGALLAEASHGAVVFVVFTFDGRDIFEADYRLVHHAVSAQRLQNPQMFWAALDLR